MATLRTSPFGQNDTNLTPAQLAQLQASDMSSLGRGYEAGRIGTDINSAAAQEALLRANGGRQAITEADTLRGQIGALQQRQAMYAPEVGRVEDVGGVGDALSYAAGQVGQGVASMQDPLAVGAALQGAGNVLGKGPGAMKLVGAGLRGAGYVAPFAMNQRQMTGEAYNAMVQDPELMARTTAQERNTNANLYGAAAGALDTVVPGMIAGKLTGGGLRQGISQSGLGARTLGGMAMEGTTELAQQVGQQQTLGFMNPNRDTSGDFSENLNSFVGGAIGAGPMVLGGEMADSGYRRTGDTARRVSEKTGEVVDLLSEKTEPYTSKTKDKLGKVVDLFKGSVAGKAKGMYTDYEARSAERDVISGMPPDNVDANDAEAYTQWYAANAPKRMQTVAERLGRMVEDGDEQAAQIYEGLRSSDDEARANALEEGAGHILNQDEWVQFGQEAERRTRQASRWANKFGEMAGAAGRAVGGAAVDFGKSVISGAAKKNAQGMEGENLVGKSNNYDPFEQVLADQALEGGKSDVEDMKQQAAQAKSYQRAKLMSEYLASEVKSADAGQGFSQSTEDAINGRIAGRTGATRMPQGSPEAMTGFMKDIGLEIADLAENWSGATNKKSGAAQAGVASPVKGREALAGPTSTLKGANDSKPQQFDGLVYSLNRVVRSLKVAYGQKAEQIINELQAIDRNSAPELFDYMREELTVQNGPRAARHNAEVERDTQNAVIASISDAVKVKLVDNGISLHTPDGKAQLVRMVKAVDDGVAPPAATRALEQMIGKETLLAMRRTLRPSKASSEDLVDDGGVVNGEGINVNDDGEVELNDQTDFDKALGQTKADKMGAARTVGFYGTQKVRTTQGGKKDVFARGGKVSADEMRQFDDELMQRAAEGQTLELPANMRRPRLVVKGDKYDSGEDAVEGSRRRLEKQMGVDYSPEAMITSMRRDAVAARKAGNEDEAQRNVKGIKAAREALERGDDLTERARGFFEARSEGGKWGVRSTSVKDYMDAEGYNPEQKVALYRDYLRQDALSDKVSPEQRKAFMSVIRSLGPVLADLSDQAKNKVSGLRLAPADRRRALEAADRYFADRFMNVADQATDAAPEQIGPSEISDMADLGDRIYDYARTLKGENAANEYISEANVLVFKGKETTQKGAVKAIRIPAKELVKWAKSQRETFDSGTSEQGRKAEKDERFGNTDKDMQYLQDLMTGISALIDSGVVDGEVMPYKVNQFGKSEFFGNSRTDALDGLPPSLALVTTTAFGLQKRAEGRQANKKEPSSSELRRKRVADEKAKAKEWDNEFFVVDPVEYVDRDVKEKLGGLQTVARSELKRTKRGEDGRFPDIADATVNGRSYRTDRSGTAVGSKPDTADTDAAFNDVRSRTKAVGRDARKMPLPQNEIPLTAASRAQQRADEIIRNFMPQVRDEKLEATVSGGVPKADASERYYDGVDAIMLRLRMSQRDKKDGGGAQYAIPVVVALSPENIARMDLTPSEAKDLGLLRKNALRVIDNSDLNKTLKAKFGTPAAPEVGASLGKPSGRKLNTQQPGNKTSTQAERDAATAEIIKTIGKDIDVRFEALTGYSGEYLDKDAAIVISLTPAAGTLQTAYHEALHAFVARLVKGNDKATRVLDTLANHEPTMDRVRALLAGYPEALKQLTDGEERIAYIYQFWRAGLLDLPVSPGAGMLHKLRKFFRGIFGQVSDLERSGDLLGAFARGAYAGNPSVAGKVLAQTLSEGTWAPKAMRKMDGLVQKIAALTVPAQSLLLMSDSKTAQKLGTTFWTNPGDEDAGRANEGYLNARERMAKRYTNEFSRIVNGFTERDHKDVTKLLQAEVDPADIAYQPHREAVEKIRGLLQRFRAYMTDERGMKIGDRGPLYFPRVWSPHRMTEKKAEFMEMMRASHPTYDAEAVYNAILKKFEQNTEDSLHGRENEDDDAVLKPTQNAGNERILDFITGEQAQPFLEQSLVGTLSRYFHEGARAAEYTARFGQKGERLELALSRIHGELRAAGSKRRADGELKDQDAETKWVTRQMRDVSNAIDAMEGTLGRDISDGWRKTNSWVTVYQNVRLLPMALFSSIVDPLGMVARGASMRDAYDGFLRGMSEVVKNWGEMVTGETKERKADKWERLAMAVGSVDAAVFNHHVSDEYASVFMSAGAKRINDFMFKANGMEAWNRGMRVAATRAAALFILRHKSLPDTHSARWLKEIGLTPADVHVGADGELITSKHVLAAHLGISVADAAKQVERVHYAINRWVQGAVLTPNAAQRPAWGSDPHYSMFFHLKQFSYSFHQTILKRAVTEMNHGNLAPMGAFAWYIPVMIAADITKGLIQGGGELPAHMKGMDLGDWMAHGAERAGLLGLGQVGVDAGQDVASIGGPAVEQIIDAYSDPLERTMIKAAPAHSLYAEILK